MLEIKNAKKFFNKGKRNEIKAIDDTTLTLGDNGLVALLGPSGCGKTTLLNVIGGLDNLKSGEVLINGERVNNKFSYKTDEIRNINVGYIFQDYKLIENMSVYENVAIVLKMIGIKDPNVIKERVEYSLEKVGMLRYKRRPASMLSGGERQRVGIARAIVKDPLIILADEPTGNLDSKNSLEVMKIIKAISKEKLVVLVTHEVTLAKFYASRIIEISDGKVVKDYKNEHNGTLDYENENTFYLKDFENHETFKDKNRNVEVYSNNKDKLKISLVIENGNVYIKSENDLKISIVDEESSTQFVDDHYKEVSSEDIVSYNFDIDRIDNKKYSSIFSFVGLLKNGFRKVFGYSPLKKILLAGFFLSGMFLMYAVSSIFGVLNVRDSDFVTYNKEYLIVNKKKVELDEFLNIENRKDVDYILPGDSSVRMKIMLNDYYQTNENYDDLIGSITSIKIINDKDIILGRMPLNKNELVVDKLVIKRMIESPFSSSIMSGLFNEEEALNRVVKVDGMDDFVIVGIVDNSSPSIYTFEDNMLNIIANSVEIGMYDSTTSVVDYNLYKDKIKLTKGRYPENDYEVILNSRNEYVVSLNSQTKTKVGDRSLKVVGFYDSEYDYDLYLVNNNTVKYNLINNKDDMTILSNDKDKTLNDLRSDKLNIRDSYTYSKEAFMDERRESVNNKLLIANIILAISLVEIYLMIRSSFLSRVKEVGILRAIGVKKLDIYKMFFGEIFAVSTLASLPGIIFMSYILKVMTESETFSMLTSEYMINPFIFVITLLFVYLFNLVVGLLPVFNTIRKTPAAILSRYDVD